MSDHNIPREPEHYSLSTHAGQQCKHRDIGFEDVAETIRKGRVKNAHGQHTKLFIREYPWYDDPIGVVANYNEGVIVTVEYRFED